MKAQSQYKSRTTRQIVILEAFDALTAVYRIKKGNELTPLVIISIGDFLFGFEELT
jgi:hypothetical protein